MPAITLELAQEHLDAWLAASLAVASGQSYEIDTGNGRRQLTRVNAEHIDRMIKFWEDRVTRLSATSSRRRTRYVEPDHQ